MIIDIKVEAGKEPSAPVRILTVIGTISGDEWWNITDDGREAALKVLSERWMSAIVRDVIDPHGMTERAVGGVGFMEAL